MMSFSMDNNSSIRQASLSDLPALLELEQSCWPLELRVSDDVLKKRVTAYPKGQYVIESQGIVYGVIYSQRISNVEDLESVQFSNADDLHQADGTIGHILSLNVSPNKQNFCYGDKLLEYLLQYYHENKIVEKVVGVTRCNDYKKHSNIKLDDYIQKKNYQGRYVDAVLRLHQLHGAKIISLVAGYRPNDFINQGNGVLVEYDLCNRLQRLKDFESTSVIGSVKIPPLKKLKKEILDLLVHILGDKALHKESHDELLKLPLFEMGFDSADLLDFKEQIQLKYNLQLAAQFFFEYNTASKIIDYLANFKSAPSQANRDLSKLRTSIVKKIYNLFKQKAAPLNADQNVAIIGVACRLPGGINHYRDLWNLLAKGDSAIGILPENRWQWPDGINPTTTHVGIDAGGFISDIDCFDAHLFRISPYEAQRMDPQQRLMLELSWACLEDAGYSATSVAGTSMGVFVGASGSDYQRLVDTEELPVEAHSGLATSMAVIANRISYFFDLQGPSIQLDTACSSSLVAIHTAIQSLRANNCDAALVGGVNVICHPANSLAYYQAGMLSPEGQCKTFDESANGYVRSEGCVVMLLKTHAKAIEDKDHIYAVIKGSAINHGGQAGGLTVPNATKQANLITNALADANINPASVSYIEAHGTGTALGDPIEVQGLRKAFHAVCNDGIAEITKTCGLGSLKTNMGHLEATAGIAGLLKIILSLQHGKLPPSINYTQLNSEINLEDSPFYIVDQLIPWEKNNQSPRVAGVGSFGSGGSNAYVIVEEDVSQRMQQPLINSHSQFPALIVLSADSEPQLIEQARLLLTHIQSEKFTDAELPNLAYTLQVGREAMNERLALSVNNIESLVNHLENFTKNKAMDADAYRGSVKKDGDHLSFFKSDDDAQHLVDTWLLKGKYDQFLELWVKGLNYNWNLMYQSDHMPHRISLPTYPFLKEHHWIGNSNKKERHPQSGRREFLHPLLHKNTSNLSMQRFTSTFTGKEFFFSDHRIKGEKILPGVAYLEMARAAVENAIPEIREGVSIHLNNVVWSQPIIVNNSEQAVHITLVSEDEGQIGYEIYTQDQVDATEKLLHSQGVVSFMISDVTSVDFETLKSKMTEGILERDVCYQAFKEAGLNYGVAHQGLQEVYQGDGELLAKLSLPLSLQTTQEEYVLHPSLLDAALQSTFALLLNTSSFKPSLPFALDRLEILGPCPAVLYSWVRYSAESKQKVQKLDIDLFDDAGKVCVRLCGYSSREFDGIVPKQSNTRVPLLLKPLWKGKNILPDERRVNYAEHRVFFCGVKQNIRALQNKVPHIMFFDLQPEQDVLTEEFKLSSLALFEAIQNILKEKPSNYVLIQVFIPLHGSQQVFSAVSGLLKTANLENPKLIGQVIAVEEKESPETLFQKLQENSHYPEDQYIRYESAQRQIAAFEEIIEFEQSSPSPWRENGVYLITGGAGALGMIFAQEIAQQVKNVTLILTGRSPLNQKKEARLKELASTGVKIEYHVLDVSNKNAVSMLIQNIEKKFSGLHGIIHSAGIIKDNFILKKNSLEFAEVLAPKVAGCVNLDKASEASSLDFFVLFSSIMGVTGNIGQADYAVANGFMDAFSKYRNALVESTQRSGHSLSINWPLWREGGMGVNDTTEKAMQENLGMVAMETMHGIRAFYRGLASKESQVLVVAGDLRKLKAFINGAGINHTENLEATYSVAIRGDEAFQERVLTYLKKQLSTVLKLPFHQIEVEEPFEKYGIDSILVLKLTNELENTFGSLSKTLFFEYQTLQELSQYFLEFYQPLLIKLLKQDEKTPPPVQTLPQSTFIEKSYLKKAYLRRGNTTPLALSSAQTQPLDIAIIGISGRYPEARNLEEFWQNLCNGRDCITEVPKSRWDWRDYYTEDRSQYGRHYSKWGGFIADIDKFDPLFFKISPHEAALIDPQERLFLEHVWMALEDAGYKREDLHSETERPLAGQVGVYAGVMYGHYQLLFTEEGNIGGNPSAVGSIYASIANRVSYFLNLHGPSMAVDTMCSSSLTAIHLACQDLRQGLTNLGIAGGVNVSIHPSKYLSLSAGRFISSQGHCESFGEGGDGYIPGEGVGVVLLKRLADAQRDNDHIYGIIKGSGLSHGGKTNGYTVPNLKAQKMAISRALQESQIDPRTISYIEAHGTGTKLGDPIEISALSQAFGTSEEKQYCSIGSVKSNIGHCESAAGIAGLTKVLLQMRYGYIVPSLHSKVLNPNIDFASTPFTVNQELRKWERPFINGQSCARIAGVSSFGAGGSNAHLLIEEYMDESQIQTESLNSFSNPVLILLSAKKPERLKVYAEKLLHFMQNNNAQEREIKLSDFAYTLQVGREAMEARLGFIVESQVALIEKLQSFIKGSKVEEDIYLGQVESNKEVLTAFTADEELQEAINKWIERKKFSKLLEFWVKGLVIDWNKLYGDDKPRRISLPTYPFEEERYWVPEHQGLKIITSDKQSEPLHRATYFLKKAWHKSQLEISQETDFSVIIFHNQATTDLAKTIAGFYKDFLLVEESDISREGIKNKISAYTVWIDLTGMIKESFSLQWISVLQTLLEEKSAKNLIVLQVTQGLEAYQNDRINLAGAASTGLYRMLQSEYSSITSRHLDLDPKLQAVQEQAAIIQQEIHSDSRDVEVCYRGKDRYVAVLEETEFTSTGNKKIKFTESQVLLVTGGTKGLGLLCARHLVKHYGVKQLVLTGREHLPAKDEWNRLEQFSSSIREKIKSIQALEALGVHVRVLSLPLDNLEKVQYEIKAIESSMGSIAGIIHAAGSVDFQNPAFIRKSTDGISEILTPKIQGTMNLVQSVEPSQLQFFLLFSSVSATIPSLAAGQSDYAMANTFMDYFAEKHHKALPILSIQWPSWQATGFGEVKSQAYLRTGLRSITDEEGLNLLDIVLANLHEPIIMPVVATSPQFDPKNLMQSHIHKTIIEPVAETHSRVVPVQSEGTELKDKVQGFLQELFETELKLKSGQLNKHTPFADYGVDSILLAQLLQTLQQKLEIKLEPSVFLEYTTLEDFSVWLMSTHAEKLNKKFHLENDNYSVPPIQNSKRETLLPKSKIKNNEAIAVIGMACRFPGAADVQSYWELLSQGRSAIQKVPETHWGISSNYYAGLVDDVHGFDPKFFMLSPEDIQAMDPQALVLLEESLKAIYHAGYTHQEMNGSNTGVYIGARSQSPSDFSLVEKARNPIMTIGQNYLAANLSQFFNFQGPAIVVDTACSSSLVAMKVAVDALQSGAIDIALVGGVSLLTTPAAHEIFSQRKLLQEQGEFHILDRRASGVVLGEGAGVVLLKSLSQAEKDGDCIYAVIDGIAINNDGRTAGPATPNIKAQKSVMQMALQQSTCMPKQVRYLDVNGSGSEVTDLLEIKAVESVYRADRSDLFYLGSMKPNIGHPLCAEGIASFIKVTLMLHHQCLVPFLSGQEPLEHYSLDAANFAFPKKAQSFELPYAALNCFADGGTNGHVILKHYIAEKISTIRAPRILPILNRVDVRTLQPILKTINHVFEKSKVWKRTLTIDHPILKNHKVYGETLLPGLAWIDLLYQWFAEIGISYKTLELKNLSIYRPMIVSPEFSVELSIEAHPENSDYWKLIVSNSALNTSSSLQDFIYLTAEMHRVEIRNFNESVCLKEMRKSCEEVQELKEIYRKYQTQDLIHTGLMQAEGTVYSGSKEHWVHVLLNEEGQLSKENYLFHPALIDGSAIGASDGFSALLKNESRLFLPLFYESFYASLPIVSECYTRIQLSSVELKEELISQTMEFFTPDGNKIGELKQLKNKMVRNAKLINSHHTETSAKQLSAHSFDSLDSLLKSIIAAQIGASADSLNPDAGYYELGLDSVILLKVVKHIESALSIRLSPTLLFEYTNIASLSKYLLDTYGHKNSAVALQKTNLRPNNTTMNRPFRSSVPISKKVSTQEVAIIGMAGRYPQASNINEFWENLKAGKDCITEIPKERWDLNHFHNTKSFSGRGISKWGGFIDRADCFDPDFFGISAGEAELMDPQERLFLEICWEAMEDAGYTPENLVEPIGEHKRRPVGVFVGVMHQDYAMLQNEVDDGEQNIPLSFNHALIANRVSYFCNFHGPSLAIDTVCASSLTAVHLAIESILRGESKLAFAGGVNLSLHPSKYQTYGLLDMHSSDGYCHSFGIGGDGYVSAEGIGAVLLKPLEQAITDGDSIYAVIKGSSINHGGKSSGMYVPNPIAQETLIADCLKKADIDPESIGYVEAHGTGTLLGDPIELQGLTRAFRKWSDKTQFCALGSVKSNIGHAESAAGISALTKTVLQLHHKILVKSLHSEEINPYLDFASSPFYVQQQLEEWKLSKAKLRRAGVSAFGATGSNAHIILEEFPPHNIESIVDRVPERVLLPISAKNSDILRTYIHNILRFLEDNHSVDLLSLAYTLQTGRVALEERLIILVSTLEEAKNQFKAFLQDTTYSANLWRGTVNKNASMPKLFEEDASLQAVIQQWGIKKEWKKIADLWIQGYSMHWEALYERPPQRMHLPTYPFAKKRYWVSGKTKQERLNANFSEQHPLRKNTYVEWQFSLPGANEEVAPSFDFSTKEKAHLFIRQLVATQLKKPIEEVEKDSGFFEIGLASNEIISIAQEIISKIAPDLLPSKLFEHPTISELSAYLAENFPDAIDRLILIKIENKDELQNDVLLETLMKFEQGTLNLDEVIMLVDSGYSKDG